MNKHTPQENLCCEAKNIAGYAYFVVTDNQLKFCFFFRSDNSLFSLKNRKNEINDVSVFQSFQTFLY